MDDEELGLKWEKAADGSWIAYAGNNAAFLKMADLLERGVVEWTTDVTPSVQFGLIPPKHADELRAHPELMVHFLAEMKRLAQQLRAKVRRTAN